MFMYKIFFTEGKDETCALWKIILTVIGLVLFLIGVFLGFHSKRCCGWCIMLYIIILRSIIIVQWFVRSRPLFSLSLNLRIVMDMTPFTKNYYQLSTILNEAELFDSRFRLYLSRYKICNFSCLGWSYFEIQE